MESIPATQQYEPTPEAKDLHAKHVAQAWTDQQASTDAYDNNLLTYSSAALGLSIAFIKDIVPLEHAEWLNTLYFSWVAFASCIMVTIASFQISAQAQVAHTKVLADYYLRGNEKALDGKSFWSKALPVCTALGGLALITGIALTLFFVSKNINHYKETKAWEMTTKSRK